MEPASEPVPVTLLFGFLGAGKTTLLNRILAADHGEKIAVIVNEFGDVGIDGSLVVRSDEEVVELTNGCVCCAVRGDLTRTVNDLLERRHRRLFATSFDRLLIEASGLAAPGPVLQTFELDPRLAAGTRREGVLTLVHAARVREELGRHPEVEEQVGYADCLVVNHTDQSDAAEIERVEAELRGRNAIAPILRAERCDLDVGELFRRVSGSVSDWAKANFAQAQLERPHGQAHVHTEGAATVVLRSEEALDLHALKIWLQFLSSKRDHELWRLKGRLRCREHADGVVVQGVYQWLELGPCEGEPPKESVLVLIGRGLDAEEIERGWRACLR